MNTEVEDIKARLSVKDVIGGYVQLTKAGVSWKGLCPFHNEKSPSFVVNEERASWHCFGCNKGGDIFSFVMEMDGLSFPEALALLAERAGVVLERRTRRFDPRRSSADFDGGAASGSFEGSEGVAKERMLRILDLSSKFFEKQLWDGAGKKIALPYLQGRGLSDESIRMFRLGYALPGWRMLSDFLAGKGFSLLEIETAGMMIRKQQTGNSDAVVLQGGLARNASRSDMSGYDRFRDRVTFPILDTSGRVLGFSARVLPGADDPPAGGSAKYINTPETPVYHKSRALYGIFPSRQALRSEGFALLVEGNMDVIAMHQAGFSNTMAVSGTALTDEQLRLIKRYTDTLRLFFDMDSAGQKAARKSAEMAISLGFSVSIISLPSGKDAAEMAKENIDALREAVSHPKPAPEYFLEAALVTYDAKSAEGKRRIADDFLGLVSLVPQRIEQMHWAHVLADRIGVPEQTVVTILQSLSVSQHVSREVYANQSNQSLSPGTMSFERQSEKLGRDVAGILLACPALLPLSLEGAAERVFSAVATLPILSFLAGETPESFSFANIPSELKDDAAALSFVGEKLLGISGDTSDIDVGKARAFFDATWQHFVDALRKEDMQSIERAMRVARERNDTAKERQLIAELVRVGGEK
ncbi:MAG: DNA primase [Candidatus Moraniibacteriota bacterium]|nr:MAG: DNA primase [Candidatus Moranbacteria bacterium]